MGLKVVHGDPWPKWVLRVCMGFEAENGTGGSNCGLGASGLPPLAPFGLIGLGHLGPRPLMKRGDLRMVVMARGPRPPRRQKDTPRPKNKDRGLGIGDMEIG
ncbi:hypothetical protein O181_113357 [Austropuccinia psidii MF-1]|uniref:Uncharacterized protein n=1 Tax=Austropuccinia psidii MF-1 TaxID=1389203 RepID=A0A9Q3K3H8_9BASI|nr:hypothetical protein [Austropuccinia psidii MF-1]